MANTPPPGVPNLDPGHFTQSYSSTTAYAVMPGPNDPIYKQGGWTFVHPATGETEFVPWVWGSIYDQLKVHCRQRGIVHVQDRCLRTDDLIMYAPEWLTSYFAFSTRRATTGWAPKRLPLRAA